MITIPTTAELYEDILADLEAEYGESIPAFGKVFLRAVAGVQAAKLKLYYLAIANIQKNIFVDTADSEASGGTLERFGRIKLGRNPFPATAAQYEIEVTGTIGAVIDSLTTFKSDDDSTNPGKLYILDTTFTLASSPDTLVVRALEAGLDSQLDVGDTMTATIPIANVNKQAEVVSETVEPLAEEDIEDYRDNVLEAYRLEPQGGAASDYRIWASDAQGVRQVYAYAKTNAPGEINLYVEANRADSTDSRGTPSAAILEEVEEVVDFDPDTTKPLNERGRRPLQVVVNYEPVSVKLITIEISSYTGITTELQAQNLTALDTLVDGVRPFVAGADVLSNQNDILNTNKIIGTLLDVNPGAVFGTVTLKVDGVAMTSRTFIDGDIPFLQTVSYL
jgi:uncharacterized phage protein gp47/JayE